MRATAMQPSQREIAQSLLEERGIVRLAELRRAGVTAATVSRMQRAGQVDRLSRGLYQLPDADLELHHSMAEVAKRVPKGVVCLVSALAFHELTLEIPSRIWMAIGTKDWAPKSDNVLIQYVRIADHLLEDSYETHVVEGVPVKVFSASSAVVDCFRHRNKVGLPVALEGLQEALRQRKATPAEIASEAVKRGGFAIIRPYLEALTANG